MRCVGDYLLHHVLDLGQLVHQVDFVMQTARCVDQYHIRIVRFGGLQRVESYGSRVRSLLLFDDGYAYAFAPDA